MHLTAATQKSKSGRAARPARPPHQMANRTAAIFVVVELQEAAPDCVYLIWADTGAYLSGSQNKDHSALIYGFNDWLPFEEALPEWRKRYAV